MQNFWGSRFRPLDYPNLGLNTGIPWVGFSHTVPEPAHTVTRHRYTCTRTVIRAVLCGTFGTCRLFSLKYVMYIFICKYN